MIDIYSPAKLNLALHILSRRDDGYHELESIMVPIGLYDRIRIVPADRLEVLCDHPDVPSGPGNLAHGAADLLLDRLNVMERFRIDIHKTIPVGAGLGGGSSNAAAVLTALNRYFESPLTTRELMDMGAALGADIPFFVLGEPALARGIGERLTSLSDLPTRWVVIVFPGFGVSTREAYQNLNLGLTKDENPHKSLLLKVEKCLLENCLHNDLEAVVIPRFPEIGAAKQALLDAGAGGALMSGSGSSVFGLFAEATSAQQAFRQLKRHNVWRVFLAAFPPGEPTGGAGSTD